ncbi:MAG: NADPH:quinone reductase [Candidatus Tectomicrobia bacterium]|uniref:NADPH:quinone reductase n=1 Tax=Tectimicrobiota bacterium TaxID=2528274 RepID=A0A932HXG3_UNCTE|nr:NADPH:quinone reductase [Candidatus Tectomicrobia bacterium]
MRAMRIHAYSDTLGEPLRLDEVPVPEPGPGELLVRVKAAGVNPIDLSIRRGLPNYVAGLRLPHLLGSECAGEVAALGKGVQGFKEGDRVFAYCPRREAYADYTLMEARSAARLPGSISFSDGAALPVAFQTAWHALVLQAQAGPGEAVLVQGGAGGVGIASIQLARALGCRVLTTVSSEEKAAFCRTHGAHETINYKKEDFAARCRELTGGRGADVIVELAACDNLDKDLDAIPAGGRVVLVGMGTGKGPMTTFRVSGVMGKNARVLGIAARNLEPHIPEVNRRLDALWEKSGFRVPVDQEMPLAKANECHELLRSGRFLGKLVLVP